MQVPEHLLEPLRHGRMAEFITYHRLSDEIGDIDPQYPMLRYICDRYELTIEQRYWLAFLTGATYCAPTVFYIYNEFPDYENVDVGRLERWWFERGREASIFQTDRSWIRSRNQIIPMFESYRDLLGGRSQEQAFKDVQQNTPSDTYDKAYKYFGNVKYFGRFGMFLWLEAVYVVTEFPMYPTTMPWEKSSSTSTRNGMCFALEYDDLLRKHGYGNDPIPSYEFDNIESGFQAMVLMLKELDPEARVDVWNVETTLCAYKKWRLGKQRPERMTTPHYRYPGYYLDRQHREIAQLEETVRDGVDWSVLWQFREETLDKVNLREFDADNMAWANEEMDNRLRLFESDGVIM